MSVCCAAVHFGFGAGRVLLRSCPRVPRAVNGINTPFARSRATNTEERVEAAGFTDFRFDLIFDAGEPLPPLGAGGVVQSVIIEIRFNGGRFRLYDLAEKPLVRQESWAITDFNHEPDYNCSVAANTFAPAEQCSAIGANDDGIYPQIFNHDLTVS